jgi:hypothetical protein
VTDFHIGKQKMVYSTAEVLTVSIQDDNLVTVSWLPAGESGEFFLNGIQSGNITKSDGVSDAKLNTIDGGVIVSYTQLAGSAVLDLDGNVKIVLVDRFSAYNTWMPSTSSDPFTPENSTGKAHLLLQKILANNFQSLFRDRISFEVLPWMGMCLRLREIGLIPLNSISTPQSPYKRLYLMARLFVLIEHGMVACLESY